MKPTIRRATLEDMPEMLPMFREFYKTTEYAPLVEYDEATVEELATIITNDHLMLVAEGSEPGTLAGVVGMMYCPWSFNKAFKMCAEVVWHVKPEEQRNGAGSALLDAIEPEGRSDGATIFYMFTLSTSPAFAVQAYLNRDYIAAGHSFLKVV